MSSSSNLPLAFCQTYFNDAESRQQPICTEHFASAAEFGECWRGNDFPVHVRRPEDAMQFSLCRINEGQTHDRDQIVLVTGLVLNIHSLRATEDDIDEVLARLHCSHVAFSCFDSTPEKPRLCVVIPIARPVTLSVFEARHLPAALAKRLNVIIDRKCLKADTIYPVPCCPEGALATPSGQHFRQILVRDDLPILSPADLGTVRAEEVESYLSPAPCPPNTTEPPNREVHAVFAEMDRHVASHWGGVPPIFAENKFYFYQGNVWNATSTLALRQRLAVEVYKEQRSPQQVTQLVHAMQLRYHQDSFPVAHNNSGGYDHSPSYRIALANSTIDPILGARVPSSPDHYLRSQLEFDFDPQAPCPRWKLFLQEVFANDPDSEQKTRFLQEMIGYLLIPSTHHQVMFWLFGGGGNGKSVILKVITWLLGQKNVSTVPITKLGHRFYLAQLVGKLANLCDEMGAAAVLDDEVLKQSVSGGRQQAERKGEQPFDFEPYARIVASTNTLPRTVDKTFAFFRRVRIMRFTRTFAPQEQDRHLPQKLRHELPGIFNWALEGLQRLERQGSFTEVPSNVLVQEEYRATSDPVAAFVKDCTLTGPAGDNNKRFRTPTSLLFRAYQAYCEDHHYRPLDGSYFGRAMKEIGYEVLCSNGKRYYPVALREMDDEL